MKRYFDHIIPKRNKKHLKLASIFLILILVSIGCKNDKEERIEVETKKANYPNGTYCADVNYYNSRTGTRSTYTLNVDVEDNKLVKILWNNGGWLDESHFSPEELDQNGDCSFTSDRGYQFEVSINGAPCPKTDLVDENGEKEYPFTLEQCASFVPMTEEEIVDYEKRFNTTRDQPLSKKQCEGLYDLVMSGRKLKDMHQEMSLGYIQGIKSRSREERVYCQTMIILRNGIYYLFEVAGTNKAIMGLTDFDPNNEDWQDIAIKKSFDSQTMPVFTVRILEKSSEKDYLEQKMDYVCGN